VTPLGAQFAESKRVVVDVLRNTFAVTVGLIGLVLLCVAALDFIGYDSFLRALVVQ